MLFYLAKLGMSENIDLSIFVYDLAILHPELQYKIMCFIIIIYSIFILRSRYFF